MVQETLGSKNLNNQVRLDRPKIMDSKAVLQAKEANPVSNTRKISGELVISQTSVVHYLHEINMKHQEPLNCASCYQNIEKLLTHPSNSDHNRGHSNLPKLIKQNYLMFFFYARVGKSWHYCYYLKILRKTEHWKS